MDSFKQYRGTGMRTSGREQRLFNRTRLRVASIALCAMLIIPSLFALAGKDHPYRHSVVDMPVSLAMGTVRTPEFSTVTEDYLIMIQVEKPLPFHRMECMLIGPACWMVGPEPCSSDDPLLRAEWTVWESGRPLGMRRMLSSSECGAIYEDKYIYKALGKFGAEAGNTYVVEVRFTKDGSAPNVANPHLIVVQQRYH